MKESKPEIDINSAQFDKIVELLRCWNHFDLQAYKESTVLRRLCRRISMVGCSSTEEYIAFLKNNPAEHEALFNDFLVEVTSFFRDPEAFVALKEKVINELVKKDVPEIRIWVPACATGQEAYSVGILVSEAIKNEGVNKSFRIFATDLSEESIAFSSAGIYFPAMLEGLSESYVKNYFYPVDEDRFRVHPKLRSKISFFRHNILSDPPFPYLDLICCRNLLIYFKPDYQQQVISTFHFALRSHGYLFLGSSESLNKLNYGFSSIDNRWRIYRKNPAVRLPFEAHLIKPEPIAIDKFGSPLKASQANSRSRLIEVYDSLLSICVSPGILVDSRYEILHINGDVMQYFPPIKGRLTSKLLEWAEGELRIAISAALYKSNELAKKVAIHDVPVVSCGFTGNVSVASTPFKSLNEHYYFVQVFKDPEKSEEESQHYSFNLDNESQSLILNLDTEVKELQNALYCALEEKRSSQEELQASNEELRASNEELQSSNEELQAITAEHEEKIRELISLNNDIRNLLVSTEIAAVFLDEELKIRRCTPVAEKLLKLNQRDIDRQIYTIRSEFISAETFEKDAEEVLKKGYPIESEIRTHDERTYHYRMLPYRNENHEVKGLVLTFTDTTNLRAAESAFLESEIRFQAAIDAVDDVVWSYDVRRDRFELSDRWMKMVEGSDKVLSLAEFVELVHQDDKKHFLEEFNKPLQHDAHFEAEFRVISMNNGHWKWVVSRGRAIEFSNSGKPLKILGTISDISVRKQLEFERLQRQNLLSLLCDGIGLGFWMLDLMGSRITVDGMFASIVGIQKESMGINELLSICCNEDKCNLEQALDEIKSGAGDQMNLEIRILSRRKKLWVRFIGIVSERMSDGLPRNLIGFIENIDQRKNYERDLKQYSRQVVHQKEILEELIKNMPLAVLAKRPSDGYRYFLCNPAAEKLFRKTRDEIIGSDVNLLFTPSDAIIYDDSDKRIVKKPGIVEVGERNVSISGRNCDLKVTKIPIIGTDGEVDSIFVLIEDVTEENSLTRQLQQSQKMDAIGRLAGGIAHDFNNMLQAIMGYGSLLAEEIPDSESAREYLAMIMQAGDQASSLVRQLMAFSRKEEAEKCYANVVSTLREIIKMLKRLLGDHIKIHCQFKIDEAWVKIDPVRIEQAMVNLCLNAKDAMPSGGRIDISLEAISLTLEDKIEYPESQPGNYALLTVADTGEGIPAENIEQIFEPFFTTKDTGKGTGLGLATVYAIVNHHNGFIRVESEIGKGTVFKIFLPVIEKPEDVNDAKIVPLNISGDGETVLLAEDQEMVRRYACKILKNAGYNVIAASDGLEAVELFKANIEKIDILVFDVMMPQMNGRSAYEKINQLRPGIPVVFCSGYDNDLLKSEYMVEIEGRLLAKPYIGSDLLREIKEILTQVKH
ncbi:MAG: hypothetical protein Kow0029_19780 [Candidatus Rifleibacteriota bacterium]